MGSSGEFLQRRTADLRFPDLRNVLSPLRWAVIGAAATRMYMPERSTQDFDILVLKADYASAERSLKRGGFRKGGKLAIGGTSWTAPDGFAVDVLVCQGEWCATAISEAAANLDPHGNPVIPLPYLVLTKFLAGRVQDIADCARMLGLANDEHLAKVRTVFETWLPDETADLEGLITLGRLETGKGQ